MFDEVEFRFLISAINFDRNSQFRFLKVMEIETFMHGLQPN